MHLADYMVQERLSDGDVAQAIGVSRPTVSRIRRKLLRPSWETIDKLRDWSNGAITAAEFENTPGAEPATAAN